MLTRLVACVLLVILATPAVAQDKGAQPKKKDTSWIYSGLRDVIDHGATIFNSQGDHAGCYRVYQGGLIAVRPYLTEQPDLLKEVDEALQKAERMPRVVDRAFALRRTIDRVRERFSGKQGAVPETEEKNKTDKKVDDAKKDDKKKYELKTPAPKKDSNPNDKKPVGPKITDTPTKKDNKPSVTDPASGGGVTGKVTLDGKTGITGYLTLIPDEGKSVATFIRPDGSFSFRSQVSPGFYRVTVTTAAKEGAPPLATSFPAQYAEANTSPLSVRIEQGTENLNIMLTSTAK